MSTRLGRLTGPQLALLRAVVVNDVGYGDDGRLVFLSTGRPVRQQTVSALLDAGCLNATFHMDGPPFTITKAGRACLAAQRTETAP